MSSLFLIRHGQASFGASDYDQLSALGIEQARALGRRFAGARRHLDAIYSGPCRRQIDSARHLIAAAREAGTDYPDAEIVAELDEFAAFEIFDHFAPQLAARDPELAAALAGDARSIDRAFGIILAGWARGELTTDSIESFPAFADRVASGLAAITSRQGRGKQVAVVTSGGPIGVALQRALDLAADTAMRVALVIANSSVSELRYRGADLTLYSFNHLDHLDPNTITMR